jgi:hypothetical protein
LVGRRRGPLLLAGARGGRPAAQGPLPAGSQDGQGRDGRSRATLEGGRQGGTQPPGHPQGLPPERGRLGERPEDGGGAADHPHGGPGGRRPLPGRRPADLVPAGERRVRPRRGVRPDLPGRGAEAGQGPRGEGPVVPGGAADPAVRRDPPEAGPGEARARGGPGAQRGRSQPGPLPVVPGQAGADRGGLALPVRRLAGRGHRAEGGGEARQDAPLRDRERRRRHQGRAGQGRRGDPLPAVADPARPQEARAARPGRVGAARHQGRPPEGPARGRRGPQEGGEEEGRAEGGSRQGGGQGRGGQARGGQERGDAEGGQGPGARGGRPLLVRRRQPSRRAVPRPRQQGPLARPLGRRERQAHAAPPADRRRLGQLELQRLRLAAGQRDGLAPLRGERLGTALPAVGEDRRDPPPEPGGAPGRALRGLAAAAHPRRPLSLLHGQRRAPRQVRRLAGRPRDGQGRAADPPGRRLHPRRALPHRGPHRLPPLLDRPAGRALRAGGPAWGRGQAGDRDAHPALPGPGLEPPGDRAHPLHPQRRGPHLRPGVHAQGIRSGPQVPGRGVHPWRRLSPGGHLRLVELLPRVHVPRPAEPQRLRGAGHGLPRLRRLRPGLAHGDLPPDGASGAGGFTGRGRLAGEEQERRSRPGGHLRRLLRRLSHLHGDVPPAGPLRGRRGPTRRAPPSSTRRGSGSRS